MLGRPVVSLRLVDPRFYHLDVALAAIDDAQHRLFPGRVLEPASQRVLAQLFPDAVVADEADALAFGLNLVSDGRNVVLPAEATGLAGKLWPRPATCRFRWNWASCKQGRRQREVLRGRAAPVTVALR